MRRTISLLRFSARVFLGIVILAAMLASTYVLSIGPVSKYAMLTAQSNTFPGWCSDFYQPLYELYAVPLAARPLRLYCDLWDVPYWLPDSLLRESASHDEGPSMILYDLNEE